MREAIVWSHLSHPNLLPFYGIYQVDDHLGRVCLVSPWMENGNVTEYLKTHPDMPRLPLVCVYIFALHGMIYHIRQVHDILAGLGHLHKQFVVHGDLKGVHFVPGSNHTPPGSYVFNQANILISNSGSACLADFGLSSIDDKEILRWTSLNTVIRVGGTVRWQAPELMDPEDGSRPTFSADVYSVASVMYEVLSVCPSS